MRRPITCSRVLREAEGARRRRCCTSRTGCPRCSACAIASRCCATAPSSARSTAATSRRSRSSARWSAGSLPPRAEHASRRGHGGAGARRSAGLSRRAVFPRRLARRARRARSSASSDWSDRAARSCSRRSSACTAAMRAQVRVDGRDVRLRDSPRDAARAGIALVPEERQRQGLFFNLTLRHNLVLPARTRRGRRARSRPRASAATRDELARRLADQGRRAWTSSPDALSGGNQQKVVLAKWLATVAARCCCSTSRPRAWTSARSSRSTRSSASRRPRGAGVPRRLERPAGGAGALRPDPGHARRAHCRVSSTAPAATEESVMHLATAELR